MNQADNHGYTPLHATSFNGQVEVVKALIVARADLHHVNDYDDTALSLAIIKGHDDILHFLENEINWLRLRPLLLMRPHEDHATNRAHRMTMIGFVVTAKEGKDDELFDLKRLVASYI